MTLIIGARCLDGVVIAGDRRVLRGTEYSEEKKILEPFKNFVIGASGISGLMDKFLYEINHYLISDERHENVLTWRNFSYYMEDLAFQLFERYGSRLELISNAEMGAYAFDVLYAYKEYADNATLFHMYPNGFSTEVKKFDIIGHGYPHAMPFFKTVYNSEMKMDEIIKLCIFIFKLIDQEKIDLSVGGVPQIFKIPDKSGAVELSENRVKSMFDSISPKEKLVEIIIR